MLTEGSAPDPKCKIIISSFLTLLHLLDSRICTKNVPFIVLLLQMMGDGIGRGWLNYIRVCVGGQGLGIILLFLFYSCAFRFCCLTFSVRT